MQWDFLLDGLVVKLHTMFVDDKGTPRDIREEIRPGGNFCGVKYAALMAAERGALEISPLRYAKWRDR